MFENPNFEYFDGCQWSVSVKVVYAMNRRLKMDFIVTCNNNAISRNEFPVLKTL